MKMYIHSGSLRNLNNSTSASQKFLINWINSYKINKGLTPTEVPEKFRTGVFPLELVKAIDSEFDLEKTFFKPRSKAECLMNIEIFLKFFGDNGVFFSGTLGNHLYLGKSQQAWEALEKLLEIHVKRLRSHENEVLAWVNLKNNTQIRYGQIAETFKNPIFFTRILQDFTTNPEAKSEKQIFSQVISILTSLKIPVFFTPEEFSENCNNDFIYMQLHVIFEYLQQKKQAKKIMMSTKTSSKSSINCLEYSFNDSPLNLENMEKKIVNEERKLMFLSEVRMKLENTKLISVPSIREIPHSSSQPVLSQSEVLICYLLTPRIVQLAFNNKLLRVLINVLPDESRFQLKNEKYFLECKELAEMTTVFLYEIEEIEKITSKAHALTLWINRQAIQIVCKTVEECEKYHSGLSHLMHKF